MREDEVCKVVRYDELAILFGNRLTVKFKSPHHYDMIRAKLRLIGRFLLALESEGVEVQDFQDALRPQRFDDAIKGINAVAGLRNGKYSSPATAFSLGLLLKDATKLLITECIKKEDNQRKKNAQDFLKLLESELNASINKTVTENWSERQRQKKVILPSREDIKILITFLHKKRKRLVENLKETFSYHDWLELSKSTLVSILIFNRRRPGELERSTIDDYNGYVKIDSLTNKEIYDPLSEEGKKCAREYVRFRTRGKKGRTVPVLLDKFMNVCVDVILKGREEAGVSKTNPYIFGIPTDHKTPKYLRAYRLLKTYAEDSKAKCLSTLKSTELRKHIATTSVKLNLAEFEVENLQQFMGHADKIHKEYYRQPLVERDILNMSKLLTFAQGDRSEFHDIAANNIDQNVELPVEESSQEHTAPDSPTANISRKVYKRAWSTPEKKCVLQCFHEDIRKGVTPSANKYSRVLAENLVLHNRNITSLKAYINNLINRRDKIPERTQARRNYWTTPEKKAIRSEFSHHIQNQRYPSMTECRISIEENPDLQRRTPKKIWHIYIYMFIKWAFPHIFRVNFSQFGIFCALSHWCQTTTAPGRQFGT